MNTKNNRNQNSEDSVSQRPGLCLLKRDWGAVGAETCDQKLSEELQEPLASFSLIELVGIVLDAFDCSRIQRSATEVVSIISRFGRESFRRLQKHRFLRVTRTISRIVGSYRIYTTGAKNRLWNRLEPWQKNLE